jgi:hypothetical protein
MSSSSKYVVSSSDLQVTGESIKLESRKRYEDRKIKILNEVAKNAPQQNIANDGYPTDRIKLVEQLKECRWKLIELTDALDEQLIINAERSKLTPEKVPPKKVPPKKVSKVEASKTGETQDSAKDLQQWYTIDELAEECMEKFKTHCSDVWQDEKVYYVEPSAGEGDILLKLPKGRRKGVDLQPKNDKLENMNDVTDRIEKMNFFETTRDNLNVPSDTNKLVLIGNPPFGDVASQFFDHATKNLKADYIAWILPNSFLSRGKRNKIDPHYHLIYVMNITCCYVHKDKLYNLATMFGIWKYEDIPLLKQQTVLGSPDFELITDKKKKEQMYNNEKIVDKAKAGEEKTYFWMRKVVQHKNTIPQPPTHVTAQSLIDTYEKTTQTEEWKKEKLLGSFCIKCRTPELHKKVYEFFSKYDWAKHIGQFASGRSKKDWDPPTRIIISKTMLYSAYNNDFGFRPYEDIPGFAHRRQKTLTRTKIIQKQSETARSAYVVKSPNSGGGHKKKRTKKKARRKRRKRSKRKYK